MARKTVIKSLVMQAVREIVDEALAPKTVVRRRRRRRRKNAVRKATR